MRKGPEAPVFTQRADAARPAREEGSMAKPIYNPKPITGRTGPKPGC
ncbi:MAG: hypothetical protein AAFU61_09115 [Pseudomonadota bacterium]